MDWLIYGFHPVDASSYASDQLAEDLSGYSGLLPMVHLPRGETFRRYLEPGFVDGKMFVFWVRDYQSRSVPGPERSLA